MRFLGITIGRQHHFVTAEARGDHSNDSAPPLRDIATTVEAWLGSLGLPHDKQYEYQCSVECWRVPVANAFYGVKAMNRPAFNRKCVELRVRPRKSTHQWKCYLVCESKELASSILDFSRPAATQFVVRTYRLFAPAAKRETDDGRKIAPITPVNHREQRRETSKYGAIKKELGKTGVQKQICFILNGRMTKRGVITLEDLHEATKVLKSTNGREDKSQVAFILSELVELGLIEPTSLNCMTKFKPTLLFLEHLEDYKAELDNANLERLRARVKTLQTALEGSKREEERLRDLLEQQVAKTGELTEEIARVESEIDEADAIAAEAK